MRSSTETNKNYQKVWSISNKTFSIAFFLIAWQVIFPNHMLNGQNAIIPDILPSADAAALGKAEEFPVSYNTGQAQIEVPVTSIDANGLSMNFSLNYDGSGIMVDQHPGWVGQNWALNGGGVITRSKMGPADEESVFTNLDIYNAVVPYVFVATNLPTWFNLPNTDSYSELQQFALDKILLYFKFVDTQPDIFSFNFLGRTGKFYLDQTGAWKIISDHNIKVELDVTNTNSYSDPLYEHPPVLNFASYDKVFRGFKISDEQGYTYTFGYDSTAIEYSMPFFEQNFNTVKAGPNWIANAWYLTKVEDFAGNEIFNLTYDRSFFTAHLFETWYAYLRSCKVAVNGGTWIDSGSGSVNTAGGSLNSPVYLKKVSNNSGKSIEFTKSNCNDLEMQWTVNFYAGHWIYWQQVVWMKALFLIWSMPSICILLIRLVQ